MSGPVHPAAARLRERDLTTALIRDRDLAQRLSALQQDLVAHNYRAAANAVATAIEQAVYVDQARHGAPGRRLR